MDAVEEGASLNGVKMINQGNG